MSTSHARQIYINLPVKDLKRSIAFFTALGFSFNPQFTDEQGSCMILSDLAFVMLLGESRFKDFTRKQIADAHTHTEALLCISAGSREEVDRMVHAAIAAGGSHAMEAQDHGFMYGWSFYDLDGHHWEVAYMDMAALPA